MWFTLVPVGVLGVCFICILIILVDVDDLSNFFSNKKGQPVTAEDLGVAGALTVLMKDAIRYFSPKILKISVRYGTRTAYTNLDVQILYDIYRRKSYR